LADQESLSGRAGQLFEAALEKAPNHPKALWYGAIAALQDGDLRRGRDRLQQLLAQEPPEELRGLLQRQIDDLSEQLGEGVSAASADTTVASTGRTINVEVTIAPALRAQIDANTPLFVLARNPAGAIPRKRCRCACN
jgi:cytochrome c-type biogenesis protein CcmH